MTRAHWALPLLALLGCADTLGAWPWDQNMDTWHDQDGDGHAAVGRGGHDCADLNPDVYPGAVSELEGHLMATVCPGTFAAGSPVEEVGSGPDETQRDVTLTGAYEIGVVEVTQAQFERLMRYQPSRWPGCLNCPVETVTWHMAAQFTNVVSYEAGLQSCYACESFGASTTCEPIGAPYDCEGFRLPTEAEWERAARAGTQRALSSGGELLPGDTSNCGGAVILDNGAMLDHSAVYCGNDAGLPAETATLQANPWGLFDMHGNVWEWVHDGYGPYDGDATDPWGPATSAQRVKRGGAWSSYPQSLRSAGRSDAGPSVATDTIGFRLARSIELPSD